jgi:hypothetical protein
MCKAKELSFSAVYMHDNVYRAPPVDGACGVKMTVGAKKCI